MTVAAATTRTASFCRICAAHCGILVDIDDGRAVRVVGDPGNPMSAGFTCVKGRQLPALVHHPDRLLHAWRREPDGSEIALATDAALDEIADRLRDIIDAHGPRAVAMYSGNGVLAHSAGNYLGRRFLKALGSPMWFSSGSIDQPGKEIAHSLHGSWGAGMTGLEHAAGWLFVGVNPFVSLWAGTGIANPIVTLRTARANCTQLVVIDPRRTETAALADHHIQLRPGTDAELLAGAVRHLFATGAVDEEFCRRNVEGVESLRAAVEPFTAEVVAERCGVDPTAVALVAEIFTRGPAGATAGTGPNMAGDGTLVEYLLLALISLSGAWPRAGHPVANEGVLVPSRQWVAAPQPVHPAWDWGEEMRGRKLPRTVMGMPTAAAPDDILSDADDRVRALIVIGGNPVAAWPDQHKVVAAMEALELLVCVEVGRTATTRFADYVIPGTHQLEVPESTVLMEVAGSGTVVGRHWPQTYAMYTPAVVAPPVGADVVDETHVFFRLAQRLGLQLKVRGASIDMADEPSIDWILDQMTAGSRVPLDTVRQSEHGYAPESDGTRVVAAESDDGIRLDVAHPMMLAELAAVAGRQPAVPGTFALISRRMLGVLNSVGQDVPYLRGKAAYNPAYLHPEDIAELGLQPGAAALLEGPAGRLRVLVQPDPTLRRGLVSCAHAWGDAPGHDDDTSSKGSNTNRIVDNTEAFDPISGIPKMSAVTVTLVAEEVGHAS
jgi:anaerobic selenocysteine-containing dehydrogenase